MLDYQVNEYVWDRIRKGPAVVVGLHEEDDSYTVAEIIEYPQNHLGRIARRKAADLCRYVKVLLPEDAARDVCNGAVTERVTERVIPAMEKRGIEWR